MGFQNTENNEDSVATDVSKTANVAVSAASVAAPVSSEELRKAWAALKASQPRLYPREGAALLGVSEEQIIATGAGENAFHAPSKGGAGVVALLNELRQFGPVLFIIRNDDAVLEKAASLQFSLSETHGRTVALAEVEGVRLWFSPDAVASVWVVHAEKFVRRGVQFYDKDGVAVLKAYISDESQIAAFDAWAAKWLEAPADGTAAGASVQGEACAASGPAKGAGCPHAGCAHGSVAPVALPADSFKTLLKAVAKSGESVTLALTNGNAFFSVTASGITKVVPFGPWYNVLDDSLHTHLRESAVVSAEGRVDEAAGVLRLSANNASGKPVFWLRVAASGAAAGEVLQGGKGQ
jgi:putative hemin transport protein